MYTSRDFHRHLTPLSSPSSARGATRWVREHLAQCAIGLVLAQIILLYVEVYRTPSFCPVSHAPAEALLSDMGDDDDAECYRLGIQGPLKSDAIATVIIAPDREIWKAFDTNQDVRQQVHMVIKSYEQYAAINVVVITHDCTVMKLARRLGLATLRPESGTDVGDLTYNHAFVLIQKYASTAIVGFANSDIMFGEGLEETVHSLILAKKRRDWTDLFAVGVRKDIASVPSHLMPYDNPVDDETWVKFIEFAEANSKLYLDNSADYFLWNRDWSGYWIDQPPFVFGGAAFDNWIVGWTQTRKNTATINLTPTVDAFRLNPKPNIFPPGFEPYLIATMLNSGVFNDHGMKGLCDVTKLRLKSDRDRSIFEQGLVSIVKQNE